MDEEGIKKILEKHFEDDEKFHIGLSAKVDRLKDSTDESPTNAVLFAKLEAMSAVVLVNQTQSHEVHLQILTQTTKSNGRITALEKSKNMFMGALVFINIFVVPIAIAAIIKFVGLNK